MKKQRTKIGVAGGSASTNGGYTWIPVNWDKATLYRAL